jgi:hypothetical protein
MLVMGKTTSDRIVVSGRVTLTLDNVVMMGRQSTRARLCSPSSSQVAARSKAASTAPRYAQAVGAITMQKCRLLLSGAYRGQHRYIND